MNIHYFVPSVKDVITSIFSAGRLSKDKGLRKKWRHFGNEKELGQSVLLKELPLFKKKKMLQNYSLYSRTARLDNLVL